ncbi:MAG: helix-turn-helix domain-containing protein [Bacilli bacterium]|nr:helix-turn-helix domain-containing protein [Bacilli bacterium]
MNFNDLLIKKHFTQKRLSELSGVPRTTIVDLCTHKTFIKKCNVDTVYKISKVLGVSMEYLIELDNTYEIDPKTFKPKDNSYLEKTLPTNIKSLLIKLNNALLKSDLLKYDRLYIELLQELVEAENSEQITANQKEYLLTKYMEN